MNDEVSGCDVDFREDPTPDEHVDYVVLFADISPDNAERLNRVRAEWEELFNAS